MGGVRLGDSVPVTDRPAHALVLMPEPSDVAAVIRPRPVLKYAKRCQGLRCIGDEEVSREDPARRLMSGGAAPPGNVPAQEWRWWTRLRKMWELLDAEAADGSR